MTGIEIVLVQGEQVTVVARGAADEDFGFELDVVVPTDAHPGAAELEAFAANGAWRTGPGTPLVVLAADEPRGSAGVVSFGPTSVPDVATESAREPRHEATPAGGTSAPRVAVAPANDDGDAWPWVAAVVAVLGLVAVGVGVGVVHRRRR